MKNVSYVILFAIAIICVFSGCAPKQADIQAEYLGMLKEPASEQNIADIGAYLDKNLGRFDTGHTDQMVVAYEDYIYALNGEAPDYRDFLDRYEKYISKPLAGLYEIKIEEQESPMVSGGVLLKTWRQLCDRALSLEVFTKENKNNQLVRDEASEIYGYYMKAIFMGSGGTPIFDPGAGSFNKDALKAYTEFTAEYPDTTVAGLIDEYLTYLDSIQFSLGDKDQEEKTAFSDTCAYLISEAGKRVMQ